LIGGRREHNWREFQRNARSRWTKLSREDLESIARRREKLMAKLRERYGLRQLLGKPRRTAAKTPR